LFIRRRQFSEFMQNDKWSSVQLQIEENVLLGPNTTHQRKSSLQFEWDSRTNQIK
jgi:hypothetical protein